jgi:hypothetical protein
MVKRRIGNMTKNTKIRKITEVRKGEKEERRESVL